MGSSPNYYDLLGVLPDATEKDILRGYRRKALTCHPDKNPDNPKAAQLFIELSDALEILTDASARAAFDKVLKAKEAARLRTHAFDSKRKRFKEDLEKRENAAQTEKENDVIAAEQLAAQIRRLREEGSRLLREQQELLRKQLDEERKRNEEPITPKLKVKWAASKKDHQNGGYNESILMELFGKYGQVSAIVLSRKKNGLAIIEFGSTIQANMALEFEKGLEENPVTITWLDGPKQNIHSASADKPPEKNTAANAPVDGIYTKPTPVSDGVDSKPTPVFDDDFENLVLTRMRQAEERKRLTQQIIANDMHHIDDSVT